jgi:hypothetical protein
VKSDFFTVDKEKELIYVDYIKWKDNGFMITKWIVHVCCSYFDFILVMVIIAMGMNNPSIFYAILILASIIYSTSTRVFLTVSTEKKPRGILYTKIMQLGIWLICLTSSLAFAFYDDGSAIPEKLKGTLTDGTSDKFFIFILLELLVAFYFARVKFGNRWPFGNRKYSKN